MNETITYIRAEIATDAENKTFAELGYNPIFVADERARLIIVGHAPGLQAQQSGVAWGDRSGDRLIEWLGLSEATFRDAAKIALLPMDFYYQGRGPSGDRPPRKGFAKRWHPRLLAEMPNAEAFILCGQYAVKQYLGNAMKTNLTKTVKAFADYLPRYFPLVHPSPLNNRWLAKNNWFLIETIPALQNHVAATLGLD